MSDASERLVVLLSQEENIYKTSDYLARMHAQVQQQQISDKNGSTSPKKRKSYDEEKECDALDDATSCTHINKHWREKICEWAYQVVDHFDLNREVVSIAMNHLDRFLDNYTGEVDKDLFQLLAMTCLYLSIKLNEYKHLLIPESTSSMDTILRLSRGAFNLKQMEQMEYEVLQRLRWHVHPPTPQLFIHQFLPFISVDEHEIHDLTQFMIELSVMDYFFVSYTPSEVAIASLMNVLHRLYPENVVYHSLAHLAQYVDLHTPAIAACRERLVLIYAQANEHDATSSLGQASKGAASSSNGERSSLLRTTSPVSVMAAPHSYDARYDSSSQTNPQQPQDDEMETDLELEDYDDF